MMGYAHMGYYGLGLGFIVIKLACLVFAVGLVLLVIWLAKNLNKKQLKKLVVELLLLGILGMALGSLLVAKSVDRNGGFGFKDGKLKPFGEMMEDADDVEMTD